MNNTKAKGSLLFWNSKKSCGVISCRQADGKIFKYFLHLAQVELCVPLTPYAGCTVWFDVDETRPPTKPHEFWRAIHAEVLNASVNTSNNEVAQ